MGRRRGATCSFPDRRSPRRVRSGSGEWVHRPNRIPACRWLEWRPLRPSIWPLTAAPVPTPGQSLRTRCGRHLFVTGPAHALCQLPTVVESALLPARLAAGSAHSGGARAARPPWLALRASAAGCHDRGLSGDQPTAPRTQADATSGSGTGADSGLACSSTANCPLSAARLRSHPGTREPGHLLRSVSRAHSHPARGRQRLPLSRGLLHNAD
jgi:hypothetical protein